LGQDGNPAAKWVLPDDWKRAMPDYPATGVTFGGIREAIQAGARLRFILCVRHPETGRLTPYLRFVGTRHWRYLRERRGTKARDWVSFERLRDTFQKAVGTDLCYLISPAGRVARRGLLPAELP
jgi:hypothetical protein